MITRQGSVPKVITEVRPDLNTEVPLAFSVAVYLGTPTGII